MTDAARILDRGYRTYDGPRTGVRGAMRSVAIQTLQRVLGIKRGGSAKIVPVMTVFFAYVPAIVFVGAAVLTDDLPLFRVTRNYSGYYFYITAAIVLFAAITGPQVLCPDRRSGMLGLYLASPLGRDTYVLSKGTATAALMSLVTVGPPLLLLLGYTVSGVGPDGPVSWIGEFAQVVLAGLTVAVFFAVLTLAVSATTTRPLVAGVSIVLVILATSIATGTLVEGAGLSDFFGLIDVFGLPFEVVLRIFDNDFGEEPERTLASVPTGAVAAAYFAWVGGLLLFVRTRYQRLDVTR